MRYRNIIYFGILFFILIGSAIAFNANLKPNFAADDLEVDFTINNDDVCSGVIVSFTSEVTGGEGELVYAWDFGDGITSAAVNPGHAFSALGCGTQTFTVTLTVTDEEDVSVSVSHPVTIKRQPNINFIDVNAGFGNPFENCNAPVPEYTVEVDIAPGSNTGCVTSYNINWGDGTTENNVTFPLTHEYTTLGSFNMVITGYGANGCTTKKTYNVKNSGNPTGGLVTPGSTINLCLPVDPIGFAISNWGENPPDTYYQIDYGDGTTVTLTQDEMEASAYYNETNPAQSQNYPIPHTYTESNCPQSHYTVYVDIITSCGESNLSVGPITIYKKPEISFTVPEAGCVGMPIPINNTSDSGFNINCNDFAEWHWDMGDGTVYTNFNPGHFYSEPGTYTITLIGENYCGVTEPFSQEICIEEPITPEFTIEVDEGCATFSTILNNTTDLEGLCGDTTFEWVINYTPDFCGTTNGANFINGTDANSDNPEIEFTSPGIYEIILEGTSGCGSSESESQEIVVKAPPEVSIETIEDLCETDATIAPIATVEGCGSSELTFLWSIDIGSSPADWEFINGTDENSEAPEIIFNTPDSYTLTLEVTNDCGTTTVEETFVISPVPEITNTDDEQELCSGSWTDEIIFESSLPDTSYIWEGSSPTNNISGVIASGNSDNIPSHELILNSGDVGTVVYIVTPFITEDCPGEAFEITITVNEGPTVTDQPESAYYCLDSPAEALSFLLSEEVEDDVSYQWYFNSTGIADPSDPGTTPIDAPEGTEAVYTPPTDAIGTLYYFCVINFGGEDSCGEIMTIAVPIEVVEEVEINDETPLEQLICSGATSEDLTFAVTGGVAEAITYQWYASDDEFIDDSDTPITGADGTTYNPGTLTDPGIYYYYATVEIEASMGCTDTNSEVFSIEVIEKPEVVITPEEQTICTGVAAELLEAVVTGGIDYNDDGIIDNEDYDFQWYLNGTPAAEVNDDDNDDSTFGHDSSLPAGVYEYHVEISQPNSLGCEGISNTVSITVIEGPSITTQPVGASYCLGDSMVDLEVIVEYEGAAPDYQWFVNDTSDTDSATPVGTNSNTLTIPNTDVGELYYYGVITFSEGGCDELMTDIVQITIGQVPEISDFETVICSEDSFSITPDESNGDIVPSNTTYTWPTPIVNPPGAVIGAEAESIPTQTISQTLENTTQAPATVTYTVTPVSGDCEGEPFEVEITVNPAISVQAVVTQNDCYQSNNASIELTISGGIPFPTAPFYDIDWSGPNGFSSTDKDLFNLEAGDYELTVAGEGDCLFSETYTITEPEELIFSEINFDPETITCFGEDDGEINIEVTGGTLPYVYEWTKDGLPFSSDEDITDLGPGNYVITVTDANDCGPITQSFLIEEPPLLEVSLEAQTDVLCYGDATGAIEINVAGGRPNYTFSWTGPNGFASTNQNIDNLPAGDYSVLVTDSSGCTDTLDFTITQNDEITVDVTTTQMQCYGDNNASITINGISGGVAPYDIGWSNFGTGMDQTNLSPGTYTITITDAVNCSQSFSYEIEAPPVFLVDPEITQMSCAGANDASIVLNFQGGTAPISVVWDDGSTEGVERNNLGPGTYTVTITDGASCIIHESFTIYDLPALQLSAYVTQALDCDDVNSGAINLQISGGTEPYEVIWSNGETTENLENIPPNTYYVTVADANGCQIDGSWEVNRFDPIEVEVHRETQVDCESKTVSAYFMVSASGGVPPYQYNWSSGVTVGPNNEVMITAVEGLVVLEVTDSHGCSMSYNYNVELPSLGDAHFQMDSSNYSQYGEFAILDPIQFINFATGDYESVLWNFGDGNTSAEENPVHTYLHPGSYKITQTVTYEYGCVYVHTVTIVIKKGYNLIIPNAFTPNDDGMNDFFSPKYVGLKKMKFDVYDKWGSLIYSESGEIIRGWNGKVKGADAQNGNYYYTFSGHTFYGDVIKKQGSFVLIK